MDSLKPCPFCGNRYTAVKSDGYYDGEHKVPWFQVVCHRCESRGPRTYGANGYELAMAEWDRAERNRGGLDARR